MRSRSSSLEDILNAKMAPQQQSETRKRSAEHRSRLREPPEDTGTVQRNHRTLRNTGGTGNGTRNGSAGGAPKAARKEKSQDLSREDLIFMLSLLEGELQVPEAKC